jgi:hypothetical protein
VFLLWVAGKTFIFSDKRAQGCAHSAGTFETGKEAVILEEQTFRDEDETLCQW